MFPFYALILRLTMIATGSYLLADMSNLALKSYMTEALKTDSLATFATAGPQKEPLRRSRPSYRSIIKKNIFNSAAEAEKPTKSPSQTATAANPSATRHSLPPLKLTLIGTAVSDSGEQLAVVKSLKAKKQSIYRKGDQVAPGAKIIDIDRNQIVLLRGSQREVLKVITKSTGGRPTARRIKTRNAPNTKQSDAGGSIRKVSEDQWVLDRRELDDALKNLPKLLTQARVVPTFKDGKPDGFRIFAIAKDSLYAKIGLQNGDILHRINGVDVKNPQNFMKVVEDLKDQSNINVDLVRNNNKETFSYEVR